MTAKQSGVEAFRFVYQTFAKDNIMNQTTNAVAPSYTNSLVQTPQASGFLELAATETGRKAFLGDPEKFDSDVGPDILNAQIALRDGVETIGRIIQDPTRNNDVQKHEAAGIVAERTIEALEKAKAKIESRANYLLMAGQEDAQATFRLDPARRFVHEHILAHMTNLASKPDGTAKLRQIIEEDGEAAAVFANTKPYLLNMNADNHRNLQFKVIERHAPDAWAKMQAGVALTDLAPRFDKAISGVRASFFNSALAAKAKLRVQL